MHWYLLWENEQGLTKLQSHLQQVLEVDVLLVCHVLQTILSVDLSTCLMEMAAHRVIDGVPRETGRLTLIALLLLHPGDKNNLSDNYSPEDAPDYQDAFEGIDLKAEC